MEALLRRELGCDFVKATGHSGGGCISQGQSYDTDRGRVFVKVNSKAEVRAAVGGAGVGGWWSAIGVWVGLQARGGIWGPGPESRESEVRDSGSGVGVGAAQEGHRVVVLDEALARHGCVWAILGSCTRNPSCQPWAG